jgi:hypothetical protein
MSGAHLIHYCERAGCTSWGCYGFGVDLRAGRRGRWFCADHRADGLPPQVPLLPPPPTTATAGLPLFGGGR